LAGHVACKRKGAYWVGKPEGTRPPGRPKLIWEDNIKMDLQKIGLEGGGGGQD
jgi:hypothetical protein